MAQDLLDRSKAALLAGARKVSPSVHYDAKGYAARWQDNLMRGLPLDEVEWDLQKGAGRELDRKLCAAHSSAALAVNTFGPWRTRPTSLIFAGMTGFRCVHFEAHCPTGLGGTAPHLDLFAEQNLPVAIESKCTEWMRPTRAKFSPSYDSLRESHGSSPWFEQMLQSREGPNEYRFLDVAQIIKHAFGLLNCYRRCEVRLVYLYWEPQNGHEYPECGGHRAEALEMARRVEGSPVRLIPMSYRELWAGWEGNGPSEHLEYLRTRYDVVV